MVENVALVGSGTRKPRFLLATSRVN